MDCPCGGITKTLYRVNPEDRTLRIRAEQCCACGRELRWLVPNTGAIETEECEHGL